jgi:hypothetical protein
MRLVFVNKSFHNENSGGRQGFPRREAKMNKGALISVVCLVLSTAIFAAYPNPVQADSGETIHLVNAASGEWEWTNDNVTGSEVSLDSIAAPNPEYMQLLSNGLSLSGATEICHPFRGGQFGWTGRIYNLSGGAWHELATTTRWVPDTSGKLMSCAYAPTEGTYALFGYYTDQPKACREYSISSMGAYEVGINGFVYYGTISPPNPGIKVTYRFKGIKPAGSVTGALSASTYTDADGDFTFSEPFFIDFETILTFRQEFLVDDCKASFQTN